MARVVSPWLLAVATVAAACGSHPPPQRIPDPPKEGKFVAPMRAAITPLFEQEILRGGMVVALIDGTAVDYVGFGEGVGDAAPGADDVFEIGSVSKVFTALLLADAAARGAVTLDTPVIQLLPFGVRFPERDGVRPTLEQLATHRAGLPPLPDNLDPTAPDPYAHYGEAELYAYLEHAELLFTPGTAYSYSNLGAGILGHVLARTLGTSYADAVTTRILEPLGLHHTWTEVPAAEQARIVPGHTAGGAAAGPWTFDVLAGAGAWRSTARDMATLVRAALDATGGKDGPLAEVLRTSFVPMADAGGDGDGMKVALGWHVTGAGVVWHNGMTGGYASFVGFDPETGRGVVILGSAASPLVTRLGIGAFDVFAGGDLDLDLRLVELPAADLDRLVGAYRLGDGQQLRVERSGKGLALVLGDEEVRLFPRSATEFLIMELEASVTFVVEDDVVRGFVLNLPDGQVPAERVPDDSVTAPPPAPPPAAPVPGGAP